MLLIGNPLFAPLHGVADNKKTSHFARFFVFHRAATFLLKKSLNLDFVSIPSIFRLLFLSKNNHKLKN